MDAIEHEGIHRLVSLECGHLFGKNCIEKWITDKKKSSTCPQCHKSCKPSHIRILYSNCIRPLNNQEKRVWEDIANELETKYSLAEKKIQQLIMENHRLKSEILSFKRLSESKGGSSKEALEPPMAKEKCKIDIEATYNRQISINDEYIVMHGISNTLLKYSLIKGQKKVLHTNSHSSSTIQFIIQTPIKVLGEKALIALGFDGVICMINTRTDNVIATIKIPQDIAPKGIGNMSVIIRNQELREMYQLFISTVQGRIICLDLLSFTWIDNMDLPPMHIHNSAVHYVYSMRDYIGYITASRLDIVLQYKVDGNYHTLSIKDEMEKSESMHGYRYTSACIYFNKILCATPRHNTESLKVEYFVAMFHKFPLSSHPNTLIFILSVDPLKDPLNPVSLHFKMEIPCALSKCLAFEYNDELFVICAKRSDCTELILYSARNPIYSMPLLKIENLDSDDRLVDMDLYLEPSDDAISLLVAYSTLHICSTYELCIPTLVARG
jgi:hypothetical protein